MKGKRMMVTVNELVKERNKGTVRVKAKVIATNYWAMVTVRARVRVKVSSTTIRLHRRHNP